MSAYLCEYNGDLCIKEEPVILWTEPKVIQHIYTTGRGISGREHLIGTRLERVSTPSGVAYILPGRLYDGPVWYPWGNPIGREEFDLHPPQKRGWRWIDGRWRHVRTCEERTWEQVEDDRRTRIESDWQKLERKWARQDRAKPNNL